MTIRRILETLICLLFVAGCARQTSPTGGPKDTIPPKLVYANPKNEQTNFKGSNLELEFTELVTLNAPQEQVIITPSVGKNYKIKSKKNSVSVEINEALDSNTTYTVNFRESVQDITEKNSVPNLKIAFSTGPHIDSLSVTGTVSDLITATPLKNMTVALQHAIDTISMMKHPSFYFTRTNDKGEFRLDYLPPGDYNIYAYEDKNKNLVVDSRNEAYGFIAKPLTLRRDTSKIQLKTLRLDTRQLKVTSARPYNTYFNIKTTKNLRSFRASSSTAEDVISSFGEDQANVKIYNTFATQTDSVDIKIIAQDSLGTTLDTTVYAKFRKEEGIEKEKFKMTVEESKIIARTGTIKIVYQFNKPVKEFNLDSIFYRKDTLTTIKFTAAEATYDPVKNKFVLLKTVDKKIFLIEEKEQTDLQTKTANDSTANIKPINELITRPSAFTSVEGDSSAALKTRISALQPSALSEIFYKIKSKRQDILVQLLSTDFKIIQQVTGTKQGSFKDLPAGDYVIRYVVDANKNNAWDPGNYLTKTEPERIYYATDPKGGTTQRLKANWELELGEMLITD